MATAPDPRIIDDIPTATAIDSAAEAYPLTINVELRQDIMDGSRERWRANLVVGSVSGVSDRATSVAVPVPGVYDDRPRALRAAAAHVAAKLS